MYKSLFKIWAAANVQESWNSDLENFIQSKKPQNHAELEQAIQEYYDSASKKRK